jgi:limonene-1,2-epoxide hydrolase
MSQAMTPKEVVLRWVQCFNKADIDGICCLYNAAAINHQVVTKPLEGVQAIRSLFEIEFARAEMHCIIELIHEAGEWAILEWSDPAGLRGCGFFHIIDSEIVFQRGYFDQLTFFRSQGLGIPDEYLNV